MKRLAIVALLAGCSHGTRVETGEPRVGSTHEAARLDGGSVAPAPLAPSSPEAAAITPPAPPAKIKLMIRTNPPKVWVYWGKKKLGLSPLNIERPRDSGPVDLVLRADGYFPVHTRAYTVKNDLIGVKMVKLADRMTLYGAKQELPPDEPAGEAGLDPLDPSAKPAPTPAPTLAPPTP